jgi:hypothetical protein
MMLRVFRYLKGFLTFHCRSLVAVYRIFALAAEGRSGILRTRKE